MSRNGWSFVLILSVIILCPVSPLSRESATPPLLDEKILEKIADEVSGSVCFEHIRYLSTLHRIWGSKGHHQAAQYLIDKCVEYGLEKAKIEQYPLCWMGIGYGSWTYDFPNKSITSQSFLGLYRTLHNSLDYTMKRIIHIPVRVVH